MSQQRDEEGHRGEESSSYVSAGAVLRVSSREARRRQSPGDERKNDQDAPIDPDADPRDAPQTKTCFHADHITMDWDCEHEPMWPYRPGGMRSAPCPRPHPERYPRPTARHAGASGGRLVYPTNCRTGRPVTPTTARNNEPAHGSIPGSRPSRDVVINSWSKWRPPKVQAVTFLVGSSITSSSAPSGV